MPEPELETTAVVITVLSAVDSSPITNANIVFYDADKNEPITRFSSDSIGESYYECTAGNYFVKITSQGYKPLPPQYIAAVPFEIPDGDTTVRIYYMQVLTDSILGQVDGYVYLDVVDTGSIIPGVLVIAEDSADQSKYSVVSGPDGYFVLFNLPYGNYAIYPYKSGHTQADTQMASVSTDTTTRSVNVTMNTVTGGILTGSLQFVATNAPDSVDVALLDSSTFSTIPGLTVFISGVTEYQITDIPPGRYLAWASFRNDGYVVDPDGIFKFGYPMVTFNATLTTDQVDFKVTGAIDIVSPTNPPDSIYPAMADSIVPTFIWTKQSSWASAKEYIIEVKDINGNVLWGGYNRADGSINHDQIVQIPDTAKILYNFDGRAVEDLVPGEIYQWKLYADNNDAAGVQTLLSSSEDLMGLFVVPAPPDTTPAQ
jgi:hypothetical protein